MLLRVLHSYCAGFAIKWFLLPNSLYQGKLFVLFTRSCLWKINIFLSLCEEQELLQEQMFAKNCQDLRRRFVEMNSAQFLIKRSFS